MGRFQLGCVHRHGGQRWRTQEHSEEREAMSAWTRAGLSCLSTDPKRFSCSLCFCLLYHLITHLQIIQETLEVKSSLCCIPIVIGPNVFKSSGSKHSIMILCKQRGKNVNGFIITRRCICKGHKSTSRALECPLGDIEVELRMVVTKNKFNQASSC